MRAASILVGLLLLAGPASADSPVCRHLDKQIEHYDDMRDRAAKLGSAMWVGRANQEIAVLKGQRRAAGCKETASEAMLREIAMLTALLKAAGQGALTFFTMGAM